MATPVTTRRPPSDHELARLATKKRPANQAAKRTPKPTSPRQPKARNTAASKAVAAAFARIAAERYPGTTWLPVEPQRSDDPLVVPAGKLLRLLPGPADMNASAGIGNSAAPTAHQRAPYEHSADPSA